ncbi:dCTP deaminase [Stenotrophomonas phage Pokken]|uniref:Deoxycytidine triphosphate deaminase n=1 Tax=Stenotrophomonas phage Pokken TaxID=2596674 RepID=A0A5B9N4Y3_9CAUD|nr:dCTP deaminase [Stenotrophomonas phage Pokken]QEG09257.1 deoxycytidine triphosphate deaminase [Stenotrophomonas phage Pokken]
MIINGHALLSAAPIVDMVPHKITNGDVSYGLGEAGYDIRIKQKVRFYRCNVTGIPKVEVDDSWYDNVGTFTLASAIEEFQMPSHLVGIVHDKSTWARRGLSVFNTVIEPGWKGFLTLELVYHGWDELVIPAGSGIAQVVFHETACNARYNGKYQNQEDKPVAARKA